MDVNVCVSVNNNFEEVGSVIKLTTAAPALATTTTKYKDQNDLGNKQFIHIQGNAVDDSYNQQFVVNRQPAIGKSLENSNNTEVCLEDGLADDDSWVEEISQHDAEDYENETTPTASDSEDFSMDGDVDSLNGCSGIFLDREEELRGYHRSAIDFTLHTIVEESCEESEVASLRDADDVEMDEAERRRRHTINHHNRLSASDLEKYFFFGLGEGKVMSSIDTREEETASEVSSECSESLECMEMPEAEVNNVNSANELASSRLEKYFLSGFMGFNGNEKQQTDESGSVGSDSEGHPSPSQRRKRLVRARGTPRSQNSSLDNLLIDSQALPHDSLETSLLTGEVLDSSESECCDDTVIHVGDKSLERKKQVRKRHDSLDEKKLLDHNEDHNLKLSASTNECRTPTPGAMSSAQAKKQQHHSRDSGFVGSNDDLLKSNEHDSSNTALAQIAEDKEVTVMPEVRLTTPVNNASLQLVADGNSGKPPLPPASVNLVRKDSFNNWSSDEETNLMMCKMRQFFKTLVLATANAQQNNNNASKPATPSQATPVKVRTPQLIYFENELTRLMKTVPGIKEEQVREIVEYLSSEDNWSDSYDSSDYTSSDLEGSNSKKGELKQQISASCQQIINKFEIDAQTEEAPDTALVYQKLVASFSKIAAGSSNTNTTTTTSNKSVPNEEVSVERSPQLFAKVMQHIGTRLVALMHEVSSGNDTHGTNSPMPAQRTHKRLQAKISVTTTEDEEESQSDSAQQKQKRQQHLHAYHTQSQQQQQQLQHYVNQQHARAISKSHDLLLDSTTVCSAQTSSSVAGGNTQTTRPHHHQSSSGVYDAAGEECGVASDYERFSWRGSFESALLANGDSRTKLSQLDRDNSSSASALAVAKRRSAGDLLFNHKSLSREQLDRVRSCGSIGGGDEQHHQLEHSEAKPWLSSSASKDVRRSSVPDAIYESDSSTEHEQTTFGPRSTLPRSLAGVAGVTSTNSLPRLPTTASGLTPGLITASNASSSTTKSQGTLNYISPSNAKSARYRAPGLASRASAAFGTKKASSSLSLQHFLYSKRDARKRANIAAGEILI